MRWQHCLPSNCEIKYIWLLFPWTGYLIVLLCTDFFTLWTYAPLPDSSTHTCTYTQEGWGVSLPYIIPQDIQCHIRPQTIQRLGVIVRLTHCNIPQTAATPAKTRGRRRRPGGRHSSNLIGLEFLSTGSNRPLFFWTTKLWDEIKKRTDTDEGNLEQFKEECEAIRACTEALQEV